MSVPVPGVPGIPAPAASPGTADGLAGGLPAGNPSDWWGQMFAAIQNLGDTFKQHQAAAAAAHAAQPHTGIAPFRSPVSIGTGTVNAGHPYSITPTMPASTVPVPDFQHLAQTQHWLNNLGQMFQTPAT